MSVEAFAAGAGTTLGEGAGAVVDEAAAGAPDNGDWRSHVRDFARRAIAPRAEAMDRAASLDPELTGELFAERLMGVEIPEHYGGTGRSFADAVTTVEEIARECPGVAVAVDVHNILVAGSVLRHGTGDQRRRYLPRLASSVMGAFALSEEHSGSDAFAMTTTAEPDGAGFRLVGRKCWTSNAEAAGLYLVFARTGESGRLGISAFLVERDAPGLTVGEPNEQLGVRAAGTCDLILDGVPVRREHVLGGVGRGEILALDALVLGRVGIAAQLVGLASGALTRAAGYARERRQFGHPIADYQAVSFPLAASFSEVAAARALTHQAVHAIESGAPSSETVQLSAMAKYVASETAQVAVTRAVETFGGAGMLRKTGIEKFLRDAKVGTIYEGTSNILLQLIAKNMP